ncbi:hypothetical protein M6B38_175275 [Iris pallida]|uniref:Uncharacterized protein n=1 Tax=Iris pallida TaxID=29817 RepID=A0AAX6ER50_IRIPA|nr:hypothetical protein M6B38_175275 [Iris pallida]
MPSSHLFYAHDILTAPHDGPRGRQSFIPVVELCQSSTACAASYQLSYHELTSHLSSVLRRCRCPAPRRPDSSLPPCLSSSKGS